jgi:calcium-dependent protein kinase
MGICGNKSKKDSPLYKTGSHNLDDSHHLMETKKKVTLIDHLEINTVYRNKKAIEEEYKIFNKTLGSGGYGEVRKGIHRATGEERAIKIIYKQDLLEEEKKIIIKEIDILKKTDHPHIVKINEFFEDERFLYIVMELLEGGELFDRIQSVHHFTEKKAGEILFDLLKGVNYLHKQKIVHRDLKPENILFSSSGVLKIVDFGTSRIFNSQNMKQVHGTAYYIAPEVIKHKYNEKCDVWSCGVIFYIMLCGYPPFNGNNEEEIIESVKRGKFSLKKKEFDNVSKLAKNLVSRMLIYDPADRPSCEQLLADPFFDSLKNPEKLELDPGLMLNLKNFSNKNKMQQAVFHFLIKNTVTSQEKDHLSKVFHILDKNHDGLLSKEEIIEGFHNSKMKITDEELNSLLTALDSNQNGLFDYTEFIAAVIDKSKLINEERIKKCFDYFDKDGDGHISTAEFREIFTGNQIVDDKVWDDFIALADKNKNGLIEYDEFRDMLKEFV